ncbi:MAG: endonuclease V, partial [Planctomycetales bacterium]
TLRREQEKLTDSVSLEPLAQPPRFAAGVDVSYFGDDQGVAAYALVEIASQRVVWSAVITRRIAFPYISTFLAFRETPLLLELLDEVEQAGRAADVVFVDGAGALHPRGAGSASHLGVAADVPTIGVAKTYLCGELDASGLTLGEIRPIMYDGKIRGAAIRPRTGGAKPLYASPGHRTDVETAGRLTAELCVDHRLPEPLYWADRLGRDEIARR